MALTDMDFLSRQGRGATMWRHNPSLVLSAAIEKTLAGGTARDAAIASRRA